MSEYRKFVGVNEQLPIEEIAKRKSEAKRKRGNAWQTDDPADDSSDEDAPRGPSLVGFDDWDEEMNLDEDLAGGRMGFAQGPTPYQFLEQEDGGHEEDSADDAQGGPNWLNISKETRAKWSRAAPAPPDPSKEDLVFQMYDIDYTTVDNFPYLTTQRELIGSTIEKAPVLRMFGTTAQGQSVMALLYGFLPYCYIAVPDQSKDPGLDWKDPETAVALCREMQFLLGMQLEPLVNAASKWYPRVKQAVVSVELEFLQPFDRYMDPKIKVPFFKVTVALPWYIPKIRDIAEHGFTFKGVNSVSVEGTGISYETDVPFVSRFMCDRQIKCAQWLTLPHGSYHLQDASISTCSFEVMARYESIVTTPLSGAGGDSSLAPLRILSFDIECYSKRGFPKSHNPDDRIIQISNCLFVNGGGNGKGEPPAVLKNVLCLRETDKLDAEDDADIHYYSTEQELLLAWQMFVVMMDPDILTGYNILNFDMPYLWERAENLGINKFFTDLSRISRQPVKMKKATTSSKAYGTRESHTFDLTGRVVADYCPALQKSDKLRSYKLKDVSTEILKETKDDVDYSEIPKLFDGTPQDRKRLAAYCLQDAVLVMLLTQKKLFWISSIEMIRILGISFNDLLTRGQTAKVVTFIHAWNRKGNLGFVIPTRNRADRAQASEAAKSGDVGFEGAIVIEPTRGFHEGYYPTLDFASLYPSIMMAHNLCYSSYIPDKSIIARNGWTEGVDYVETPEPVRECFVTSKTRRGVLPQILDFLLSERGAVKKEMAKATDPFLKSLLDQRQLTIKVVANSVYGFTGASVGPIYLKAISASVTAYGREMIEKTRRLVIEKYSIKNGHHCDTKILYGDTDSVMVDFGARNLDEAIIWGKEAAAYVTTHFDRPISLTWEKVYHPFILISKKRYTARKYMDDGKPPVIDAKGVESVRRDNCNLLKTSLEKSISTVLNAYPPHILQSACEMLKGLKQMRIANGDYLVADLFEFINKKVNPDDKKLSDEQEVIRYVLLPHKEVKRFTIPAEELTQAILKCRPEQALIDTQELIKLLRTRKIPMEELIVSKQYSKTEKDYKVFQPHILVNNKMIKRGQPGYLPGDRIPYIIASGPKNIGSTRRAEDPAYAKANNISPCITFYTDMLLRPQIRLLKHIVKGSEAKLRGGDHMRALTLLAPKARPGLITMFTKPTITCPQCGVKFFPDMTNGELEDDDNGGWCETCVQRALIEQEEGVEIGGEPHPPEHDNSKKERTPTTTTSITKFFAAAAVAKALESESDDGDDEDLMQVDQPPATPKPVKTSSTFKKGKSYLKPRAAETTARATSAPAPTGKRSKKPTPAPAPKSNTPSSYEELMSFFAPLSEKKSELTKFLQSMDQLPAAKRRKN